MKNPSGALPRDPLPGPSGTAARVATHQDARALVEMYLAALREAHRPHREDLVDWFVQAVLHDPLRGICVVAEKTGEGARALLGIAVFESSATAEHGWSGRIACLYVAPESRHLGIGKWLLGEGLEFARYYGLNHVVFDARPEDARVASILAAAGLRSHPIGHYRIDLPPLYDEA
jgi:ribosomal protein S18 acetylase RimI-like enzyme